MENKENLIVFIDKVTCEIYDSFIKHILYNKSFESYKNEYLESYRKQKTEEEILQSNEFVKFTFIIMSIKTDFNTEFSYKNYKNLYEHIINTIYTHVLHFYEKGIYISENNLNIIDDILLENLKKTIKTYYIKSKDEEIRKDFYIQLKRLIKSFNNENIKREIENKIKEIYQEL